MNREEVIAIIRKEYLCVDRDCDIDRSCGKCDLMMPSKEPILEAYKMAIKALEQEPKILNTLDFAIDASNGDTNYFVGFRNGLRYSKSLIDGKEPQFESCTEQEPCEDAVSRQYLIDIATEDGAYDYVSAQEIANAPSVNPQPKTGHWIDDNENEIDARYGRHLYKCSECDEYANAFVGSTEDWWDLEKPNYCPNCGARMVEPQERSE